MSHKRPIIPKSPRSLLGAGTHGFTLVEVLIGAGIAGVTVLAAASFFNWTSGQAKNSSLSSARNEVINRIRRNAWSPGAMKASATDSSNPNPELKKCVTGLGSAPCVASTTYSLRLLDAVGNLVSEGTPGWTYYDQNGGICAGASVTCPLRAQTKFRPLCASGNCSVPQNVTIETTYTVEVNPTFQGIKTLQKIESPPSLPVTIQAVSIFAGYYYYFF